ncbi:MAG: MFS transporter [Ignavibacteria bacterium]|nr:MFS transporter [Ignavibacteria bacterium]
MYIIWGAQLIAMIGMSMVIPFLPLYIKDLGVTDITELKRWSGLVVSGVFITAFFATPVWGWLGDKVGKKKMVLRAIFGLAVSQFLIGLSQDVYQLFFFRMVQGALSGFIAASLALVSSNTPKERSGYAIGFLASSTAAGNLLGPFVGGLLADAFGYRNVFFITSVICLISGILVLFFVKEINRNEKTPGNVFDNYRFVSKNTPLKYAMLMLIISAASISMIQPLFALFIEQKIGTTAYLATITGSVFGVLGLFQVISSSFWGRLNDKREIRKNIVFALIGAGAGYALHIVVTGVWELVPIRAVVGLCMGGVMPSLFSFINKCIPNHRKGGIMGIASSFTMLGNLIGPVSSGYIASVTSINFVFVLSGSILAGSAVLAYKKLRVKSEAKRKLSEKDIGTIGEEIAAGSVE